MFKLLSKESNIFSIPVYIGFVAVLLFVSHALKGNFFSIDISLFAFLGLALGYFCINAVGITYQSHLPLCIYTVFLLGVFPHSIDIGVSVALLINGLLVLMLSHSEEHINRKNYVLIGFLLGVNFIVLPPTWPMSIFVLLHIFATSERVGLHLFRFFFGVFLCVTSYFCVAYFLGWKEWDARYLPMPANFLLEENKPLFCLIPVGVLLVSAVVDHFLHYNEKSPSSRYKYTFLLIFALAQGITIGLYMESSAEYLLFLAMPTSVLLSRFLRFREKYWQQELGFWAIVFSFLAYRMLIE